MTRGVQSERSAQGWSRAQALDVLRRGINSEDPDLRARAYVAWISAGDASADAIQLRAISDPSPLVQRTLAKTFPRRLSADLQARLSPDKLGLAWLAHAGETVRSSGDGLEALVVQALQSDPSAQQMLLERIEDGEVPAEADFFELASVLEVKGLGASLLAGVKQAEPEVRISMALAAALLGAEGASTTLSRVLGEAEDPADGFWVVEGLARSRSERGRDWLLKERKSSDHALALHSRLGLVGLGEEPAGVAIEAVKTGDKDTRAWAIECLAMAYKDRLLPREMIAILEGSTRDEAEAVRFVSSRLIVEKLGIQALRSSVPPVDAELSRVALFVAGSWLQEHAQNAK